MYRSKSRLTVKLDGEQLAPFLVSYFPKMYSIEIVR